MRIFRNLLYSNIVKRLTHGTGQILVVIIGLVMHAARVDDDDMNPILGT